MRYPLLSIFIAFLILSHSANGQNCTVTSVGFPPLNDLGTGYWQGFQGGLYSSGSNYRPALHNQQGLLIASQLQPLDGNGLEDAVNGKIVWLSVGMSNTTQETQAFLQMTDTFQMKNPKLELVDGAQGGQDINVLIDSSAAFWTNINQRLANAGLTRLQVQVIWFKEAEAQPSDTSFQTYPDALKAKFKTVMQIIRSRYPNAILCYLSSRIYAGYASGTLNPEPYAWYSGWSVKRLIEDQVNGDPGLDWSDVNPVSPWLSWGPYLWADGLTPRSDGLTWICPDDYQPDGTHPSNPGRKKVAQMLFDFFTSDSTATPWFLDHTTTGVKTQVGNKMTVYYNPVDQEIRISNPGGGTTGFSISESTGSRVQKGLFSSASYTIPAKGWKTGVYFMHLNIAGSIQTIKFVIH